MDRFIEAQAVHQVRVNRHLKSNMDRFIVEDLLNEAVSNIEFKIQYG